MTRDDDEVITRDDDEVDIRGVNECMAAILILLAF